MTLIQKTTEQVLDVKLEVLDVSFETRQQYCIGFPTAI